MKITGPRSIFTSLFTLSIYFQSLLSVATIIISCIDPLETARPEELTTPLNSLGAKLFVFVCRYTLSIVTPTCISASPTGDKPWYPHRGKLPLHCISNLPLGVTNEGREVIKPISGAVAGDSSLQDRGVAHYLLSLLFSLVSLPFSFYFRVPNQKYQK